jgi:hypothetical protein
VSARAAHPTPSSKHAVPVGWPRRSARAAPPIHPRARRTTNRTKWPPPARACSLTSASVPSPRGEHRAAAAAAARATCLRSAARRASLTPAAHPAPVATPAPRPAAASCSSCSRTWCRARRRTSARCELTGRTRGARHAAARRWCGTAARSRSYACASAAPRLRKRKVSAQQRAGRGRRGVRAPWRIRCAAGGGGGWPRNCGAERGRMRDALRQRARAADARDSHIAPRGAVGPLAHAGQRAAEGRERRRRHGHDPLTHTSLPAPSLTRAGAR